MSKSRAQRRAAKKRRYLTRSERVKPSALAEAKKRPWPMREMLHAGLITAQQFEAGIEIVAGFDALTDIINLRGAGVTGHIIAASVLSEISDAKARAAAIYLGYGQEVLKRFRVRARWVADFVRGDDPLKPGGLPVLVGALDLWHDHRDDWDPRLTTTPERQLTSCRPSAPTDRAMPTPPVGAAVSLPFQSQSRHAAAPSPAPRAMVPRTR